MNNVVDTRITVLDFLRGLAILGILFINIESFAYPNSWSSWSKPPLISYIHNKRFRPFLALRGHTCFAQNVYAHTEQSKLG